MNKYLGPIRSLGGAALAAFIVGLTFPLIRDNILDPGIRGGVLLQAIPFVAFFITVLLLYILLIVIVARYYNGRVPNRAHAPIVNVFMLGILVGVFLLFQSIHMVGYRYGFLLLLGATLGFILWSHVVPKSARFDAALPKLTTVQHVIGLVAAGIVLIVLVAAGMNANAPKEPYGVRPRQWDRYDEAQKAEVIERVTADFNNVEVPFLFLFNLFPAALIYFAVREASGAFVGGQREPEAELRPARETS